MNDLDVGDIVALLSGGSRMTVTKIDSDGTKCFWFDSLSHFEAGIFAEHMLVPMPIASAEARDTSDTKAHQEIDEKLASLLGESELRRAEVEARLAPLLEDTAPGNTDLEDARPEDTNPTPRAGQQSVKTGLPGEDRHTWHLSVLHQTDVQSVGLKRLCAHH